MSAFSLRGRTIIVTGASSGIGKACAIACSEMGARVLIFGRDKVRLDETLSELSAMDDSRHIAYLVDLTKNENVEKTIGELSEAVGVVHGVVHCAGISTILPFKAVSNKKMEEFFLTNVFAPYQLTRLLLKNGILSDEGASIVFLSSIMASFGEVGRSLYGMTKSSLVGATKSLAIELAPRKIRVNTISPGVVVTPMSDKSAYSQDTESREKIKNLHALGFGEPADVANACIYLLSSASKWVTGIDMVIDGGYSAR
jgi:NAD(P)-dependent dehydrogenase (short-subunit alcohol dehydrogenase family)